MLLLFVEIDFLFLILKVYGKSKAFMFFYWIKSFHFSTGLKDLHSFYCLRSTPLLRTRLDPKGLPGAQRLGNTDVRIDVCLSGRHFATAGKPVLLLLLLLIVIGQASQGSLVWIASQLQTFWENTRLFIGKAKRWQILELRNPFNPSYHCGIGIKSPLSPNSGRLLSNEK